MPDECRHFVFEILCCDGLSIKDEHRKLTWDIEETLESVQILFSES